MYELTLTSSERKAIDWVGDRYPHGNELRKELWVNSYCTPDDRDWDDDGPILFSIPENVAWRIAELLNVSGDLECLSPPFRRKLIEFRNKIV